MKVILTLLALGVTISAYAQQNTIDIVGMHQLINESKTEHTAQVKARNNQASVNANEAANLTLLAKLKKVYRALQQRYNTLGTAISAVNIALEAKPMLTQIINNQSQLMALAVKDPALLALGYQTEIEFAEKAEGLVGYVTGLTLSIGDINQMKASDRKVLFDYIIYQLSRIQELSGNMLNLLRYNSLASVLKTMNPFQSYVSQDKSMIHNILQNAKYLK